MSFGDYSILFQKHSSFTFGYDKYLTYYNQQNVGLVESKKGPSFPEGNGVLKNSLTPFDLLDSAIPLSNSPFQTKSRNVPRCRMPAVGMPGSLSHAAEQARHRSLHRR